jgi:hypothetical protein
LKTELFFLVLLYLKGMKKNISILIVLIALFFAGWILYSSGAFPFINQAVVEEDGGNNVPAPDDSTLPVANCYVGGCSGQICSDQEGMVSTCEFRQEYACYQTAKCERQSSGQCGWTITPELSMCLSEAQ